MLQCQIHIVGNVNGSLLISFVTEAQTESVIAAYVDIRPPWGKKTKKTINTSSFTDLQSLIEMIYFFIFRITWIFEFEKQKKCNYKNKKKM